MKKVTIIAATESELLPCKMYLELHANLQDGYYSIGDYRIDLLISGIGIMNTTYTLMDHLCKEKPDLWIQIGIGGALDKSLKFGQVYLVESERLFDFGAQDKDGTIISPFELGWIAANEFPYEQGILVCSHYSDKWKLQKASGMTVLHAHGSKTTINTIRKNDAAQIENMEGAPFFYISLMKGIRFMSLRSVSNYVEERNKAAWKIDEAINNVNKIVIEAIEKNLI